MHYGQYLNIDGDDSKDNHQLIMQYRGVSMHPEVDMAIEDIVNESVSGSELKQSVDIKLDEVEVPDNIKNKLKKNSITFMPCWILPTMDMICLNVGTLMEECIIILL